MVTLWLPSTDRSGTQGRVRWPADTPAISTYNDWAHRSDLHVSSPPRHAPFGLIKQDRRRISVFGPKTGESQRYIFRENARRERLLFARFANMTSSLKHLRRTAVRLGRREAGAFPWRRRPSTYGTLIAEMFLQHTPAARVASVYPVFLHRWPNVAALRTARVSELQRVLRPLGLQRRRAQVLLRMAQAGRIPRQVNRLQALHGVGSYTAGFTSTVLTGHAAPFADGGIARLVCRYFGVDTQTSRAADDPQVLEVVQRVIRGADARFAAWGIVDLARTVCRPKPLCATCPARSSCAFVGRS